MYDTLKIDYKKSTENRFNCIENSTFSFGSLDSFSIEEDIFIFSCLCLCDDLKLLQCKLENQVAFIDVRKI